MINSGIIDISITLCFTYLLLAIIVTTLVEIINTLTRARAKMLKKAIETMFFDDDGWSGIWKYVQKSPFIQALKKKQDSFPSYIPAKNFSLALYDALRVGLKGNLNLSELRSNIDQGSEILPTNYKRVVLDFIDKAEGDMAKFMKSLEDFYNDSMDRVSGWFKKRAQIITFIISLAVTVGFNVDSVQITKTLWQDKPALEKATNFALGSLNKKDSLDQFNAGVNINDTLFVQKMSADFEKFKKVAFVISEIPIPAGWGSVNIPPGNDGFSSWVSKIFGWLFTTIAIYLGAPFWFDLLNKFVNIRGSYKKPEEKKADK